MISLRARGWVLLTPVVFLFIGGGSGFADVQRYVQENQLSNVKCLPYQPLDRLSASLSAADMHVVIMGEPFVGIIHPCKIYNILRVASACSSVPTPNSQLPTPSILYIGPNVRHVTELLNDVGYPECWSWVHHGDEGAAVRCIAEAVGRRSEVGDRRSTAAGCDVNRPMMDQGRISRFSKEHLLPKLVQLIEET